MIATKLLYNYRKQTLLCKSRIVHSAKPKLAPAIHLYAAFG